MKLFLDENLVSLELLKTLDNNSYKVLFFLCPFIKCNITSDFVLDKKLFLHDKSEDYIQKNLGTLSSNFESYSLLEDIPLNEPLSNKLWTTPSKRKISITKGLEELSSTPLNLRIKHKGWKKQGKVKQSYWKHSKIEYRPDPIINSYELKTHLLSCSLNTLSGKILIRNLSIPDCFSIPYSTLQIHPPRLQKVYISLKYRRKKRITIISKKRYSQISGLSRSDHMKLQLEHLKSLNLITSYDASKHDIIEIQWW